MVYRRSPGNIRRPARRPSSKRRSYAKPKRSSRRGSRRVSSKCRCAPELTPSARFALAQLDPFDPRANGAKVPDSNTMPSLANVDCDQVTLTTNATQTLAAIAFTPSYQQAVFIAQDTGGVLSWPYAAGPLVQQRRNAVNVIAQLEAIRPVAHAIRASSSLSPNSATGFVHIGLSVESRLTDTAAPNMQFPTTISSMTGLAHYKRITLASLTQSPITAINKWIDELAFRYDDPRVRYSTGVQDGTTNSGYNVLTMQQSWCTIVVMLEGAPNSSPAISFEHILLSESLPKKDAFILGTPAAPNSPGTMSAVSQMTGEGDFVHTEAGQESYISQGLDAFTRGAAQAGSQVFSNVAVPLLERIGRAGGYTAANMAFNAMAGMGGIPGVNANPGRLALY